MIVSWGQDYGFMEQANKLTEFFPLPSKSVPIAFRLHTSLWGAKKPDSCQCQEFMLLNSRIRNDMTHFGIPKAKKWEST